MIEIHEFEQVTQIKMSRKLNGRALYWVAAYLVDGLLIDTGCSFTSGELVTWLRDKNVRQVVNTHFHEDHIGGNKDIMNALRVPVYAHPDSIPLIAARPSLYPYQEIVWGYPEPTEALPLPDTITTDSFTFKVIDTPGHSKGHIALWEKSRGWCFSADLFSRETIKFIRPEENIGEIAASMRMLASLPGGRLVLFTSVGKIVEDGRTALTACADYLFGLAEKVKSLAREERSVDEILVAAFGNETDFSKFTNGQFSTRNLVESLLRDM
jgi:glyoxylase-like metal-dependent hydrolase (beta-lactamase superfamily II)